MDPAARRLYVLRHAKSSWDEAGLADHDRPLAPRGRRAVKLLAEYVATNEIRPELVLCSTSRRTRETLEGVSPGGAVLIEPDLYHASCAELIERLRRLDPTTTSAMVIGHNPALQMLILRLARHDDTHDTVEGLPDIRRKFPTGALATLDLSSSWAALQPGGAELVGYVRPKALLYQ